MEYEVSVDVDAAPARVWAVLADVERWPEWTASISRVERLDAGPFGAGSRARVRQPRLPPLVWRVTEFEPGRRFTWEVRTPGATTVAGHHVTDDGRGGAKVTLTLSQTGPLNRLLSPLTAGLTRRYLHLESQGLKRRSEAPR